MARATIKDIRKKRPAQSMQSGAEAHIIQGARRFGESLHKNIVRPAVVATGGTLVQGYADRIGQDRAQQKRTMKMLAGEKSTASMVRPPSQTTTAQAGPPPEQQNRNFTRLDQTGAKVRRPPALQNPSVPEQGDQAINSAPATGQRSFAIQQKDGGYGRVTVEGQEKEMSPTMAKLRRPTGYVPGQQRIASGQRSFSPNYSWLHTNQEKKPELFTRKSHPDMPWKERQMLNGILMQRLVNQDSIAGAERNSVRTHAASIGNNKRNNQTLSENNMRTNLVNRQNSIGLNRPRALAAQGAFAANDALATSRELANEQTSTAMLLQKQYLEEKDEGKKKAILEQLNFLLGTGNASKYEKITQQEYVDSNGNPSQRLIGVRNGTAEEIPVVGLRRPR